MPRGAKVTVVSPASYPQPERLSKGVEALRRLGFEPWVGRHALSKHRLLRRHTQDRLKDLHAAFLDPEVQAIFCSRGGYGCNYLLDGLDLGLIARESQAIAGYSDLTCVQSWLLDTLGLIAFHGPMVAADFCLPGGSRQAEPARRAERGAVVVGGVGPARSAAGQGQRSSLRGLSHLACGLAGHPIRASDGRQAALF